MSPAPKLRIARDSKECVFRSGTIVGLPVSKIQNGAFPDESLITASLDNKQITTFAPSGSINAKQQLIAVVVDSIGKDVILHFKGDAGASNVLSVSNKWLKKHGEIIK